jgi:hypothetical protein
VPDAENSRPVPPCRDDEFGIAHRYLVHQPCTRELVLSLKVPFFPRHAELL